MENWSQETLRAGDTETQQSQDLLSSRDSLAFAHEISEQSQDLLSSQDSLAFAHEISEPETPVEPETKVAPETPVEPETKVALECLNGWQVLSEPQVERLLSMLELYATHEEKMEALAALQCEQLTKAFKENHRRKLEEEEIEKGHVKSGKKLKMEPEKQPQAMENDAETEKKHEEEQDTQREVSLEK